ncbi:hypothetical protein HXZ79_05555 [Acinetobacter indicus]|uniref:hypothetical protein n=1 Tax=Acinetobacter indicus TaxID=756892 RepID=UPI002577D73A|nr:hypothetical protein [Acinetobacter indicus]MDM1310732.1 hypothetical protein [Acinetobacter indicus]
MRQILIVTFIVMVVLLMVWVLQQEQHSRQQEMQNIVQEARDSLHLIEQDRASHRSSLDDHMRQIEPSIERAGSLGQKF